MHSLRRAFFGVPTSPLYRQLLPAPTCTHSDVIGRQRGFASEPPSKLKSAAAQLGVSTRVAGNTLEQLTTSASRVWQQATSSDLVKEWSPKAIGYSLIGIFGIPFVASVGLDYLRGPYAFKRRVDRSTTRFPEPFSEAKHDFVTGNGVRLHVVTSSRNTGTRPLVLFLHGFPECWYSWRHQLAAFQGSYDVAAIDMRGYNSSDQPQDVREYTLPALASDIPAVVKALGRDKCILVGHDWGAAVAWSVASLYPEVVDRIACLTVPPPQCFYQNFKGKQLLMSAYIFNFQLPQLPEAALAADDFAFLEAVFTNPDQGGPIRPGAMSTVDIERYKAAFGQPGALTAAINYYRANFKMLLHDLSDPLVNKLMTQPVDVPSMLLFADRDIALGPGLLEGLQESAPGVRLHTLTNCSHFMQQDQPEEVNRLLKAFFEEKHPAAA